MDIRSGGTPAANALAEAADALAKASESVDKAQTMDTTAAALDKVMGLNRVYCINLARRPDRWHSALACIRKFGFPSVERYAGVDGAEYSKSDLLKSPLLSLRTKAEIQEGTRHNHESAVSAGAIGCYFSHVGIWQEQVKHGHAYVAVFEDDFCNSVPQKPLVDTFKRIRAHCDIFFFAYLEKINGFQVIDASLSRCRGRFFGTQGYIISLAGAQKLLKHAFPLEVQIDSYIAFSSILNPDLSVYFYTPNCHKWGLLDFKTDIWTKCVSCWLPGAKKRRGQKNWATKAALLLLFALLLGNTLLLLKNGVAR